MTRFPLKAVETSGHYFIRKDVDHSWRHVYVNLEDETVSFIGSAAAVPRMHATSYPNAELYGPIPFPPDDVPLSEGPDPF